MITTRVGYAGGTQPHPTYHDLGDHTETLEVVFDPDRISYDQLLEVFWNSHDPTHLAWSRQYKAAVFYHDERQRSLAEASKQRVAAQQHGLFKKVRTEILPAGAFTPAEDYHQKYYLRHAAFGDAVRAMFAGEAEFRDASLAARMNALAGGNIAPEMLRAELSELGLKPEMFDRLTASR